MKYRIRKCSCGYWTVHAPGPAIYRGRYGKLLTEAATFAQAWSYLEWMTSHERASA